MPRYAIIKIYKNLVPAIFMIFLIVYSRIRSLGTMCRLRATRDDFGARALPKSTWFRTRGSHLTTHSQKQKPTIKVGLCFWWEWVDSNHLRLKPTDLQSAPALQLRRTPNHTKLFRVYNTHYIHLFCKCKQFFLVRAAGLEPAYQAWKACVLALVLCPRNARILYYIFGKNQVHIWGCN